MPMPLKLLRINSKKKLLQEMFHDIIRENSWTSKIAKHAPKLIANACEVKTICFNL